MRSGRLSIVPCFAAGMPEAGNQVPDVIVVDTPDQIGGAGSPSDPSEGLSSSSDATSSGKTMPYACLIL